jgi:hypothetical protein
MTRSVAAVLSGAQPWHVETCDVLDGLRSLPDGCVHCAVTSPPYWGLRDYGMDGQLGREPTPSAYVAEMVAVFQEVRRVLRDDATLWLNIGASYWGGGRGGNPAESDFRKQASNVGSLVAPTAMPDADEPFALRNDLTVDEIAYVLAELAAHSQGSKVTAPSFAVAVDPAITPLADRKEV